MPGAHGRGRGCAGGLPSLKRTWQARCSLGVALTRAVARPTGEAVDHADADTLGYATLPLATLAEGEYKMHLKSPSDGSNKSEKHNWIKVKLSWKDAGNPMYAGRQ